MRTAVTLPRSSPEAQGIPSAAIAAFVSALDAEAPHPHSYMLLRHGHVIAEGWWAPYEAGMQHSMFSVSKSFTSTAVGLAISEGHFTLDDRVVDLLPDDVPVTVSPNLAAMRVRHLLTMTSGHAQDTVDLASRRGDDNWVRAILSLDVDEEPGSRFVYNSGATFLLSAIVTRATGQRLLDYLRPRLLDPLGIADATWEQSPTGIDVGGWGLTLTSEHMAAVGQLWLRRGEWDGVQLVPAAWIDAATSAQVPNATAETPPDWSQGYGYQFWTCRYGAYRADGAFGQFVVVMPEQDAVLVLTGGMPDGQKPLELVWEHLLPAFDSVDAEPGASVPSTLVLPTAPGSAESPLATDRPIRFGDDPALAVRWLRFDGSALTIADQHGEHVVPYGYRRWVASRSAFGSGAESSVAASAAWADESRWVALVWLTATPFLYRIELAFDGDEVTLDLSVNVSFGPTELAHIVGRLD